MIADPFFYALAIPAILVIGLSKGGFLGGIAMIGVPVLALAISPVKAAAILLPVLIVMDVIGVWAYRHSFDKKNLLMLVPGALIGVFIGWLTAAYVSEAHVRLIVGLIALSFTLDHWLGIRPHRQAGPHLGKATFWGSVAGFTSFVSHSGAPPAAMYLLPQRLGSMIYAGTYVMLFAVINLVKVPPYFLLGQFSPENLATTAILLPLAPVGSLAGVWLVKKVPQEPFYRIAYACLFIVSVKLVWDGARAVFGI